MADEKIIFSMNGVGKVLPHNNKVILKDIYLSFFYGAKIGIIGLNGSGKSTLLKIIAGVEKSYKGEVVWAPAKDSSNRTKAGRSAQAASLTMLQERASSSKISRMRTAMPWS